MTTTTDKTLITDLQSILPRFNDLLDKNIEDVWAGSHKADYSALLASRFPLLTEAAFEVGGSCWSRLNERKGEHINDEVFCYVVNFVWADQVKSFFVLWRDVLFQQFKAEVLFSENRISEAALQELKGNSKAIILLAAEEIKNIVAQKIKEINEVKNGAKKNIAKWKLQQNPWPVYKTQIRQLALQSEKLIEQYEDLKSETAKFLSIRKLIRQELAWCSKEITIKKDVAEKAISFIDENIKEKAGRIASYLESIEEQINIRNHLNEFTDTYEKKIDGLKEKLQVTVNTAEGILQYKEINFQRNTRQWLESEIMPLFYEVWELTDSVSYGIKMSVVNIRNRVIIVTSENQEAAATSQLKNEICQPLHAFLERLNIIFNNLLELEKTIDKRLSEYFYVSNIYDLKKEFLPVPLEFTINQFGLGGNRLVSSLKKWINRVTGRVEEIKSSVAQEEMLSTPEKIVRYIQSRKGDALNNNYASIFLTKGYLGESFWVGREQEINHVKNIIDQWRLGYRGAVVLCGTRFCGKTLFGELVANRFFHENTIRIFTNNTLKIKGRKIEVRYDLGKALDFVRKNTLNERPLIWIDNLEQWSGDQNSLHRNTRQLKKFVDNYSGQAFIMVSMSNWLKNHLDRVLDFGKIVQTEIQLNRMSGEEIKQAIMIRHGATHKTLVDQEGNEVPPQIFAKYISKIYQAENGNIGDVLNQWAFSTQKMEGEKVTHKNRDIYFLPDFLNPDIAILLSTVMMEKRTNEYRLRKIFGPAFQRKYSSMVKRLIGTGLLSRNVDGSLEITDIAVNDVGRLLERNGFLKFIGS
ncbi:MAG: hypothetical protein AAFZ15_09115 [Bacteroidota bacterium]